jgi:hypothetical protein
MHKFSGKYAIQQSIYTKNYLLEHNSKDVWDDMGEYTKYVDGAVLQWLTNLGKTNLVFWHGARNDLTTQNIKSAEQAGG